MTSEEINVAAFLKLIRFAEHKTDSDDVYYLLYGGRLKFTDVSKHPNKAVTAWGHTSTAAGAYRILYPTWKEAKDKGIVLDFSKASQDKLAAAKLDSRHALAYVKKGDIKNAIPLLRKEWTSLPGAAQSDLSMEKAQSLFDGYVAALSKP